jgi:4-amino-4-deoxy-L-arabinose transferase-like glycosyltransferase
MTDSHKRSKYLLAAGILLRVVVFLFLAPLNNDDHGAVVRYIVDHGRLANVSEILQAQHPPLYYLLAAPVLKYGGSYKFVQLLSLWFSIVTLLVLHHLIYRTGLIANARARTYSMLVACLLPQFVQFSLYLSNDSLTILLGNVAILLLWLYMQRPDRGRLIALGAVTGLGLLTKLSFLAYLPVLVVAVFWYGGRGSRGLRAAALWLLLTLTLGSYKIVENLVLFGAPMVTGLDRRFHYRFAWEQAETYRGLASYVDLNVLKLVKDPVLSHSTEGAYPVIFYATFWYQYIPESNFIGNRRRPSMYLGSVIYVVASWPTAVFLIGLWKSLRAPRTTLVEQARWIFVVLMLLTGLMFLPAVMHYHVWSTVQARYLFPAMFGCLVTFSAGVEAVERYRAGALALQGCMWGLVLLFLYYFGSECGRWI